MSKASREWKAKKKQFNILFGGKFTRKDMTLKSYKKYCRFCRAYATGMKQHIACYKGRIK